MPESSEIARTAIERIGFDPDNLGFVGLKVELPPEFRAVLDPTWAYTSPVLEYVKGYEGQPHITLIYGLLFSAAENRDLVDGVLEKVHIPNLVVMPGVEAFDTDDDYALYSAIVLTLDTNEWDLASLKVANDELRKLPHVNTFPVYKPHITVGYVRREFRNLAIGRLKDLEVRPLHTRGLEYT
jgi:hypothetical protein